MFTQELLQQATEILAAARARGLKLATAESCTGGLIAGLLTEIAGSSDVFERGFVTYSNPAKTELLGVSQSMLDQHGAVSEPVARAMAEGALRNSRADIAVAVTGVAGPGQSENKPAGLVFIAAARKDDETRCEKFRFTGMTRGDVRLATVQAALALVAARIR